MTSQLHKGMARILFFLLMTASARILIAQENDEINESLEKRNLRADEIYEQGNQEFAEGNYVRAIELYSDAIELRSSDSEYYMARGQCKELSGDDIGALTDYETVIRIDPENCNAVFKRGWIFYKKGSFDRSIKDYSFVIDNSGQSNTTSIIFKGTEYNEGGQTVMTDVTTIDRLKADAYNARAMAYSKKGESVDAMIDYERAILLNPLDPNYLVNRGLLSLDLNDKESAKMDFKRALDVFPGHKTALYNLSLVADKQELKEIESKLYASGDFGMAYSKRAYNKYLNGRYEDALLDYDSALYLRPGNAEDLMNRGLVKSKLGMYQTALRDFESSLSKKRSLTRNYVHIGNAYQSLGKHEEAIRYYQLYLTFEGEDALVYYNKGIAEYNMKKMNDACFDLTRAVELGESRAEKARDVVCR